MVSRFVLSSDREGFQFPKVVLREFGFLEQDFQYVVSKANLTFVRLVSAGVEVRVYHGRGSYEVGFEIALDGERELYSMYDLLIATGNAPRTSEIINAGSTPERMQESIERFAVLARECLGSVFRGNRGVVARVKSSAREREAEARTEIQVDQLRANCNCCWGSRDYAEFLRLLDELSRLIQLTSVEEKRREIALSRIKIDPAPGTPRG